MCRRKSLAHYAMNIVTSVESAERLPLGRAADPRWPRKGHVRAESAFAVFTLELATVTIVIHGIF